MMRGAAGTGTSSQTWCMRCAPTLRRTSRRAGASWTSCPPSLRAATLCDLALGKCIAHSLFSGHCPHQSQHVCKADSERWLLMMLMCVSTQVYAVR